MSIVRKYIEQTELSQYVWRWYNRFFTDDERAGPSLDWLRGQDADTSADEVAALADERYGDVRQSVLKAVDQFNNTALQRVLDECGGAMIIIRCPECQRIVASPKARQCLWCGKSWHQEVAG